ncbi:MAG: signal peptidase II [Actinobacteria bacterium 69-20]|jgi:signal peptidase II|nr:signal peptidase II [Actinomycetota bacterium]OJV23700.1 MAG: signal peptidase II [Actinobacteria bacterium 69-20]
MLAVIITVVVADQVTKSVVLATWRGGRTAGGLLRVELVRNRGAAFGLAPTLTPLYTLLAAVTVAACLYYGMLSRHSGVRTMALALVAAGAAGNLIDRVARPPGPFHGAVIDWIKLSFYPPAFNLADIALRVGIAVFVVSALAEM